MDEGVIKFLVRRKNWRLFDKKYMNTKLFFTRFFWKLDEDDLVVTDFALLSSHKLFYCYMILIWFYAIKHTQKITTIRFSILMQHQRKVFRSFIRLNVIFILWHISKLSCLCFLWKTTLAERVHIFENYIFYHQHKIEEIHYRKEWYH